MLIRRELSADIAAISEIIYAAFKGHPYHAPGQEPTEHLIVSRLRDAGALSLSLVAVEDDTIVGHIAFSPIKIKGLESNWFALAPMSVSLSKQKCGVGSKLINEALRILTEQGTEGVVVLGYPEYYKRFGFHNQSELSVAETPQEYFLAQRLTNQEHSIPKGEVNFHEAFF